MNIKELFPTRFIGAADVAKMAPGTVLVINELKQEECIHPVTKKTEKKWIVYFKNATKGHRVRKTELGVVKGLGPDTEQWIGKEVTFRITQTQTGEGVRMIPKQAAAPATK